VTSNIDSAMIRPDIFEVPRSRSRKTMGTSLIVNPAPDSRRTSSVKKAYPSAVVEAGSIEERAAAR
jgi:hypothetical protein